MKSTISVGIPTYNEEKNINKLVKSVLMQKGGSFYINEIIISDDNSDDQTINSFCNYSDKINILKNSEREGQSENQNKIISSINHNSDYLLLLEADTVLAHENYIENLVLKAHAGCDVVYGQAIPYPPKNFFESIMNYGFYLRQTMFKSKMINLYSCYGQNGRLISMKLFEKFQWDPIFHEDSYFYKFVSNNSYRIGKEQSSNIFFKSVDNINDYILQSIKYQKAVKLETRYSKIYDYKISKYKFIKIICREIINNPIKLIIYATCVVIARVCSPFHAGYNKFWKIYKSSKVQKDSLIKIYDISQNEVADFD